MYNPFRRTEKVAQDETVILLDVGENTKEVNEFNSKTFHEEAKKCVEAILMRKIFNKPTDEVALFLFGSEFTANPLNEKYGGYENINQTLVLNPVDWDTLKFIQRHIDKPNENITADWMDALIVAMDSYASEENDYMDDDVKSKSNKCAKRIILFTTFTTEVNDENVDRIIEGLNALEIELIVITNNVIQNAEFDEISEFASFSQDSNKNKLRAQNENLILNIVKQTNGILFGLDEAVSKLIYIDKMKRRRVPWNCDLTIGSKLAIKISAYIYVREEKELGPWKSRTQSGEVCKTKTEHYHNDDLIDPEVVATDLVKGYMYGGVAVPYDDASFDNGGKALRCIGFTNESTIKNEYLEGKSIWIVVPQKGMIATAKRFNALIQAMHNSNLVIIARYTYRNGTGPKLMALFSHKDSMLMYELFYKNNIVSISLPSLTSKKHCPSSDQFEFIDKLIDTMDFSNPKNPMSDRFKRLTDPSMQHIYRVIAHRAVNPRDPVPVIDDDLKSLITPPKMPNIDYDKMKTLFPIEPVKLTSKEKILQNIRNIDKDMVDDVELMANMQAQHENGITQIGTIRPHEDFLFLLNRGERFTVLTAQLQQVIHDLVTKAMISMNDKIHQALLAYRETAKHKGPYQYNEWIVQLKELLMEREKLTLWELIVNENLGLITKHESENSTVTLEEAAIFYKSDGFCSQVNRVTDMETGENDDLFDDL